MALKDLSPEQKAKIAIQAIVGEVLGKTTAEIGSQFELSGKAVTGLKNQALDAIRQSFYGVQSTGKAISNLPSDEELAARIEKILGNTNDTSSSLSEAKPETADAHQEENDEELLAINKIVSAIEKHNNTAGSDGKKIYISRAIVSEVSPHPPKEIESYFTEHKARIDAHHEKHGLKRNSNRILKNEDWISWLNL